MVENHMCDFSNDQYSSLKKKVVFLFIMQGRPLHRPPVVYFEASISNFGENFFRKHENLKKKLKKVKSSIFPKA